LIPPVPTLTPIGLEGLVLKISATKWTESPTKLDNTQAQSLIKYVPKMESNIIYRSTDQGSHAKVHNSTGHTPGIDNQAYIKEL